MILIIIFGSIVFGFFIERSKILPKIKGLCFRKQKIQKTSKPESLFTRMKKDFRNYKYSNQFNEIEMYIQNKTIELDGKLYFDHLNKITTKNKDIYILDNNFLVENDSYRIVELKLSTRLNDISNQCLMGVTKKKKKGTMIIIHGYTSSPEKLFLEDVKDYSNNIGRIFLENGYDVYAPFILNHGERVSVISALARMRNLDLLEIELAKILSLNDYLQQKKENTFIYGISGGGLMSYLTFCIDSRIKGCISSGCLMDTKLYSRDYVLGEGFFNRNSYSFRSYPYLRSNEFNSGFSYSELIKNSTLLRPLAFELGKNDKVLYTYNAIEEFEKIKHYYVSKGMGSNVNLIEHNGAHESVPSQCLEFIEKYSGI